MARTLEFVSCVTRSHWKLMSREEERTYLKSSILQQDLEEQNSELVVKVFSEC